MYNHILKNIAFYGKAVCIAFHIAAASIYFHRRLLVLLTIMCYSLLPLDIAEDLNKTDYPLVSATLKRRTCSHTQAVVVRRLSAIWAFSLSGSDCLIPPADVLPATIRNGQGRISKGFSPLLTPLSDIMPLI